MMPFCPMVFAAILALTKLASADFLLSNTTVCMGAFPVDHCYPSVQIMTSTTNLTTSSCHEALVAEDYSLITNGTAGQFGSWALNTTSGTCGTKDFYFEKDWVNTTNYLVLDMDNNQLAYCTWVNQNNYYIHCNQWVGAVFFTPMYLCQGSICG